MTQSGSTSQGLEGGFGPGLLGLPLRQALAVLLEHLRGGFGGEVRVVELLAGLGNFRLDFLEFLGQAGLFGGGIDLAFERQIEAAQDRMDDRSPLGRLAGGIARWKGLLASFYGGIGEEVLTRLFAMTLLVWLIAWATGRRTAPVFWAAIILAAVGFAAAHIPATAVLAPLTRPVVARILVLNSLGGILFGWLYWRRGLEHAMVAHFCCDLALHVVGA